MKKIKEYPVIDRYLTEEEKKEYINKSDKCEIYELDEDVKGYCPNCSGRGRKKHLKYLGDNEVICIVCSHIHPLNEI